MEVAVGCRLPHRDAQLVLEGGGHRVAALVAVDDVVAHADRARARRLVAQERVEGDQALHVDPRDVQRARDEVDRVVVEMPESALHLEGDVHQTGTIAPEVVADRLHRTGWIVAVQRLLP